MMTWLWPILIAVSTSVATARQQVTPAGGDEAPAIRGPVRQVEEINNGPGGSWRLLTRFNEEGNPTEETMTADGGDPRVQTFSYDALGRLVATSLRVGEVTVATLSRAYNTNGQLVSMTRRDAQGTVLEDIAQQWDDAGHLIDQVRVGGPGAGRTRWQFAEDGCQSQEIQFDALGTIVQRIEQICDGSGRVIRRNWIDGGGRATGLSTHVYDDDGNEVLGTALDGAGTILSRWQYARNDVGGVTAIKRFNGEGVMVDHTRFTLNDRGDVSETATMATDGTTESVARVTYDSHGNPTQHAVSTTQDAEGEWIEFQVLSRRTYQYHPQSPSSQTGDSDDPPPAKSQEAPMKPE